MLFVGKMVACIFEEAHAPATNRKSGVGLVRFYVTYLKERTMSLDHAGPKRLTIYLNEEVWGKLQRLNNYYGLKSSTVMQAMVQREFNNKGRYIEVVEKHAPQEEGI